jgi:hypothetical protein
VFQPIYDKIIDSVKATGAKALIVAPGITDVSSFPLFRKGSEINDQAAVLRAGFNVAVAPDCGTTSAGNAVAMTVVLNTVGAAARSATPVPLSCADRPGTADGVLTPADLTVINGVQAALTNYIKGKATENGYAYMELGDLYNTAKGTTPFSVAALLGSTTPYGPNISLDGVHPSNSGSTILARSAANALNARYGFEITVP